MPQGLQRFPAEAGNVLSRHKATVVIPEESVTQNDLDQTAVVRTGDVGGLMEAAKLQGRRREDGVVGLVGVLT